METFSVTTQLHAQFEIYWASEHALLAADGVSKTVAFLLFAAGASAGISVVSNRLKESALTIQGDEKWN